MVTLASASQVPFPKSTVRVDFPEGIRSNVPSFTHGQPTAMCRGRVIFTEKEFPEKLVPLACPVMRYSSPRKVEVESPLIHSRWRCETQLDRKSVV